MNEHKALILENWYFVIISFSVMKLEHLRQTPGLLFSGAGISALSEGGAEQVSQLMSHVNLAYHQVYLDPYKANHRLFRLGLIQPCHSHHHS